MARLVKAGTPRTLPALGEYTPEEQLWLAAAAEVGKKAKGSKPQKAAKLRMPAAPARRTAGPAERLCRAAVPAAGTRGRGCIARAEPRCMAGICGRIFPGAGEAPCRGTWRRRSAADGLSADGSSRFACRGLRGQCAERALRAGTPSVHGFRQLCQNREELTLADSRTVEYLSGREIEAHTAADGWCCVTVDGWPLGGGKVSGGRVKNHYPKALRLL